MFSQWRVSIGADSGVVFQVRGLSLHDLRFRGQRIVYELATQELYVSYNGYGGAPDRR